MSCENIDAAPSPPETSIALVDMLPLSTWNIFPLSCNPPTNTSVSPEIDLFLPVLLDLSLPPIDVL